MKARTPLLVVIPEGYVGWVRIEYGVPELAALQIQDGRYTITIPRSGIGRKSSQCEPGFADDKYCYVSEGGQKTELKEASQLDCREGMIRSRQMFAI